ncbi:hypothetical protein [Evansella sp. LMS18]|nr:hypothetical protein [Evansella sp. LMS18]
MVDDTNFMVTFTLKDFYWTRAGLTDLASGINSLSLIIKSSIYE